jgi:hypothetical protein
MAPLSLANMIQLGAPLLMTKIYWYLRTGAVSLVSDGEDGSLKVKTACTFVARSPPA